ncbi:hypothetical protein VP01_372g6 [Puccinia sorghi]|uniref:Integrase catalytic domain-containing protein n=1 Tax=Puccinia sorghi TaxID=27349 RepID=A0A0L6UU01_9BASI|nr:hypothetical protein VP01_372g6 [Puccinia sorghi]
MFVLLIHYRSCPCGLKMDNVNSTILKTTIEAIPILTEENFSSWRSRITALFKLGGLKDNMLNGEPALEEDDNTILCAIILSKLSTNTQNNVVSSENEDNAQLLWKAILKRFISSEPSNRARVYNQFSHISFDISNIEKFVTEVRSILVKMEDVGIKIEDDIITYDLLNRLPSSLDNIKQRITHSPEGNEIKPETLLHHLEIHLNELRVSNSNRGESIAATMYTSKDQRCTAGTHNPNSKTHTKDKCWAIYPEKRVDFFKKRDESQVSYFSTLSSLSIPVFILDSGSSSHMVSDRTFFTNLDEDEDGVINTSCGLSTLKIKGKGSIKLKFKNRTVVFHNVLFVPKITINVISVRHLLLEQCQINFDLNNFTILKNEELFLDGHYENNLPILKLEPISHHSTHLSSAEILHKSLGHVSFCRLRRKLGIPIKASETCKSCAVVKITKASFKHRTSLAEKPFEELHLDLIGPISPLSHKQHKYILTIVDGFSRFVAAIPLTTKSEVFSTLAHAIDIEAKRLGYYPSVLHSDRGTEFLNSQFEDFCKKNIILSLRII